MMPPAKKLTCPLCYFLVFAFFLCGAFQDLKNKEKAERDARTQVAEAQHTSIKDEIAKQVGAKKSDPHNYG